MVKVRGDDDRKLVYNIQHFVGCDLHKFNSLTSQPLLGSLNTLNFVSSVPTTGEFYGISVIAALGTPQRKGPSGF